MKLYTKEEGLVLSGDDKILEDILKTVDWDHLDHELLDEKKYTEWQISKREKLDIDYSKVDHIKVDVSWSYEINGAGVCVSWVDKKGKVIDESCLISDDEENNDFHERITESCGGSCILLKDVLTYLDKDQLHRYNIKIHDVNDDNNVVYAIDHEFVTQENSNT